MQPLDCPYCRRTFHKADHLKRHELSHTKSRPYSCTVCNRAFARQDSLARHKRLHNRPTTSQSSPQSQGCGVLRPLREDDAITETIPCSLPQASFLGRLTPSGDAAGHATPPAVNLSYETSQRTSTSDLIWPDSEDLFQSMFAAPSGQQHNPTIYFDYPSPASTLGSGGRFGDQAPSIDVIPENSTIQVVHGVSNLIHLRSSNITSEINLSNLSSHFLDECLHMFFVKFIPVFPILHRPTFVFRDCLQPLLLSAMAIGSLYLGQADAVSRGQQLWKLAHTALSMSWKDMISHRGPYDEKPGAQLLVTSFLGQIYGVLSKDPAIRSTSQAFFALGFSWAKQCRLLNRNSGIEDTSQMPSLDSSEEEKSRFWSRWVAHGIQQRAVLAHYALDGLLVRTTGQQPTGHHLANDLSLQWDEKLFAAQSADEFILAVQLSAPRDAQVSFRNVLQSLLSPEPFTQVPACICSPWNLLVLYEGLQAIISECAIGIGPDRIQLGRALTRAYDFHSDSIMLTKNDKLEAMLRWHTIALEAIIETASLGRAICQKRGIKQTIWMQGDGGEPAIDIIHWPHTPEGRRALLHAVAIQEIIEDLPRGRAHAIHMPSALLSAAMVCIAFCLAGMTTVNLPNDVHWAEVVLSSSTDRPTDVTGEEQGTRRFILGEFDTSRMTYGAYRNLAYECNSLQKLFGCLATQWGVAAEMGAILRQCAALLNSPRS